MKPGNVHSPLIPTAVTPKLESGKLVGFQYTGEGKKRFIPLKNVLHDRYIDPRKPYWGVGKLEKIARWADTSQYANDDCLQLVERQRKLADADFDPRFPNRNRADVDDLGRINQGRQQALRDSLQSIRKQTRA